MAFFLLFPAKKIIIFTYAASHTPVKEAATPISTELVTYITALK
jgi:hypothetical protein